MKKTLLVIILIASFSIIKAQDSIQAKKISHEIGFNSVLLIKQIISNNPASTLEQLPYQVIYSLNFSTNYSLRLGLGINQNKIETEIQGLNQPRITNTMNGAYRLGLGKNFVSYKKIICNVFGDITFDHSHIKTTTVSTTNTFPSPTDIKQELNNISNSPGFEIGFGLKYQFNKHIALYTETPLQFKQTTTKETDHTTSTQNGFIVDAQSTITSSKGSSIKVFLPTTLFLMISF